MKIVDRIEFLGMPAGVLYAKVGDATGHNSQHYFGEVRIKAGPRGESDWWSVGFIENFVGAHNSGAWNEALDRAYAGEEIELEFDGEDSDGLYDDNQKFAILSEAEHTMLIGRLRKALQERAG